MRFITILLTLSLFVFLPYANAQLFEDFEDGEKGGYAPGTVQLSTGNWFFDDAMIGNQGGDKTNGSQSARIRNGGIWMQFDKTDGADEVSFYAANAGFSGDTGGRVQARYSTNGGSTWQNLGSEIVLTDDLTQYTIFAGIEGNFRLRLDRTAGNRISVDDVRITDYMESSEEPTIGIRVAGDPVNDNGTYTFSPSTGTASVQFQIRNNGEQDLVIESHSVNGEGYSLADDIDGEVIEFTETVSTTINFSASTPGVYTGSITIDSNDPNTGTFTLNLSAEVIDTNEPMSIAEARQLPQGTTVTVAGWLTVTDQFRGPVYFQDGTGGLAWYDDALMRSGDEFLISAVEGDSIVVTGELGNFNNLLQIINYDSYNIYPEGNNVQEPLSITAAQLNSGDFESQLVTINDAQFQDSGTFSGAANYNFDDASGEAEMRVDNFVSTIIGTPIPAGEINITGVAGRFQSFRQLLPRHLNDLEDASGGPRILSSFPYERAATPNSITFEWITESAGHSEVCYGTTISLELGCVSEETSTTEHTITVSGLDPASVYKAQVRSAINTDTSASSIQIVSTRSPDGTTGEILAYFNKSVDHNLATFQAASQNVNFEQQLIERIDNAEDSAVFAFYNISGGVGNAVANAIIAAHNRGVDVRVIGSGHTGNPNQIIGYLHNNGVRAVQSTGSEQQHNKFAAIDANHQDPTKAWVVTSSWNATDSGTFNQFQNMINIQDVALARAYLLEFNQMWGAESGDFNSSNAKFSQDKEVVNPSVFWIGEDDTEVRLFFSPQGNTESEIIRSLGTADYSINIGLNLITRVTLSNAMRNRFQEGVKVRGVIGDIGGQASQWDHLNNWGADVHDFSATGTGLLHHKYAVVDGEDPALNPIVITGSHNWSNNANTWNDENTLFIYSARVANEFIQEFGARYVEAGGQDNITVTSTDDETGQVPGEFKVHQNYPNPFNPTTNISFTLSQNDQVTIRVYDVMGREVARLLSQDSFGTGSHIVTFDASNLSSGMYIYQVSLASGQVQTGKMMLVK